MIDYTYIKDLALVVRNTTKTTEPIWSDITDVVFQRTDPERIHNNNCDHILNKNVKVQRVG